MRSSTRSSIAVKGSTPVVPRSNPFLHLADAAPAHHGVAVQRARFMAKFAALLSARSRLVERVNEIGAQVRRAGLHSHLAVGPDLCAQGVEALRTQRLDAALDLRARRVDIECEERRSRGACVELGRLTIHAAGPLVADVEGRGLRAHRAGRQPGDRRSAHKAIGHTGLSGAQGNRAHRAIGHTGLSGAQGDRAHREIEITRPASPNGWRWTKENGRRETAEGKRNAPVRFPSIRGNRRCGPRSDPPARPLAREIRRGPEVFEASGPRERGVST